MVVLSAAILSKTKVLLARQFVEMTRMRVEGLLSAFVKLIERGGKDHTFIETESVRYVYQPMESLYILLITNKQSNILEDLEILRLLASIVQDACQVTVKEEEISDKTFDIVFAFDEAISFGYRESVTLNQIKTYTGMDSHEEKLQTMIRQNKENEEKERRKKIAFRLDKERSKHKKEEKERDRLEGAELLAGYQTCSPSLVASKDNIRDSSPPPRASEDRPLESGRGMQLGKKKVNVEAMERSIAPTRSVASPFVEESAPSAVVNPLLEPLRVTIEEKTTGTLHVEGGVKELDIQGMMQLTVYDAAKADLVAFKISPDDNRFKYKVHPSLNKSSHANNILELRDPKKAFKPNTPSPLLMWRSETKSEDLLPFTVCCWTSATGEGITLTVELDIVDSTREVQDVHLQFMCPSNYSPEVLSVETGDTDHDGVTLHWRIPLLASSCTLEFAAKADASTLLPFTMEATGVTPLCNLQILECYHQERRDSLQYAICQASLFCLTVG